MADLKDIFTFLEKKGYCRVVDGHLLLDLTAIYQDGRTEDAVLKHAKSEAKVLIDEEEKADILSKLSAISAKYTPTESTEQNIDEARWMASTRVLAAIIDATESYVKERSLNIAYYKYLRQKRWKSQNLGIIHNSIFLNVLSVQDVIVEVNIWTKLPSEYYKHSFWRNVPLSASSLVKFAPHAAATNAPSAPDNSYRVVRKINPFVVPPAIFQDLERCFVKQNKYYVYEDLLNIITINALVEADAILTGTYYEQDVPKP